MRVHTEGAGLISEKRSFGYSHFSDRSCIFVDAPVRCSGERMTAWRVFLGDEAMCGFLREAVVSFVNHPSACVRVSSDEVPLSAIHPCLPKEPALQKGNRESKKER